MSPFIESLNHLAEAWARLIWAVTWQSAILVAVFAIATLGMRRSSPSLRYWVWQIAAIKLLVMPLWGVSILIQGTFLGDARVDSKGGPAARSYGARGARLPVWRDGIDSNALGPSLPGEEPQRQSRVWSGPLDWRAWLMIGWALVVAGQVAAIAYQRKRMKDLLRKTEPAANPRLLALLAELSDRTGLRRQPEILIRGDAPFVCGHLRPTLVLPRELAEALDSGSVRMVLLHELAHLKRRDLMWEWIPAIARLLYFFHPAAHYVAYRTCLERELACDQAAMVLTGQTAAGYASTLIDALSRSSEPPALRAALASARFDGARPCPAPGNPIEITSS